MAITPVTPVELYSIPRQKPSHDRADRRRPRAQQKVEMIGDQSPCKTIGVRLSQHLSQSRYKGITIFIVQKIFRRSIPRTMIWCSAPAASILAFSGMSAQISAKLPPVNQYINTRPQYILAFPVSSIPFVR
jgi:ribosomal protein L32